LSPMKFLHFSPRPRLVPGSHFWTSRLVDLWRILGSFLFGPLYPERVGVISAITNQLCTVKFNLGLRPEYSFLITDYHYISNGKWFVF
jgi:hypothetical protein